MSNRVSNCIKLLDILRDNRLYKKEELAQLLNTNPRNIIEYRKDLYDAGYIVEYKNGKFGGYYLDNTCLLPSISFSNSEKTALIRSYDFLKSSGYLHLTEFNNALIKIKANFDHVNIMSESYIQSAHPAQLDLINKYYQLFSEAIANNFKVSLDYSSINNESKSIIIHPYELVMYQNFWYVIARDEMDDKKFKVYKLSSRMDNVKVLVGQRFYFDEDFQVSNHLGKTSIVKFDEYQLKLHVFDEAAISISEKIIGINPESRWLKQNVLELKTTVEGKYNAISLVMSLGDNAVLLEPVELVDEIKKIVKNLTKTYL